MYSTNVTNPKPEMMPHTQAAFSTAMAKAQASADPRFNMKEFDRAGISRGKGTKAQAGIKAAQSLSDGVAQAYQIPAADAVTDATNNLQWQGDVESYAQGAGSIDMQNEYAKALAALQRQQNALNFQGNALNGLLGTVGNIAGSASPNTTGIQGWLDNFLGY